MEKINHEEFITEMIRYASSAESPDRIINQILQYICQNLRSDRAYIFEDNLDGTYSNTYEYCREGVSAEIENLQNVPYDGMLEAWFTEYKKSHNIIIYDMEQYRSISEAMYHILKPQGIQTLVTGPIKINEKYIGFYGVDNPPIEYMDNISILINMMEFVISMMIRLRDYSHELEQNAIHDQLTGCKNRTALAWAYNNDFDASQSVGIVMCDLNGLKRMNDSKGHLAGDQYICDAAKILCDCFGSENVYRIGGDEFAVVLTGISKSNLRHCCEQLRDTTTSSSVSLSFGVEFAEHHEVPFETLLKYADEKMYEDKRRYYKMLK